MFKVNVETNLKTKLIDIFYKYVQFLLEFVETVPL